MRACDCRNREQATATAIKHSASQLLSQYSKHEPTAVWRCDMKTPVTKLLLGTSAALAMLIAAEVAQAQEYRSEDAAYQAAPQAYDAQANPRYRFGPQVT